MGRTARKSFGKRPDYTRCYVKVREYTGRKSEMKTRSTHFTVYATLEEVAEVIEKALAEAFPSGT